jgi:hypothetical protein
VLESLDIAIGIDVFEEGFVINKGKFVKVINKDKYKVLVLFFLDSCFFYLVSGPV